MKQVERVMVVDSLEEMCDLMCGSVEENEHEYCLRCGRKLKTADARKRGYGTVCYEKITSKNDKPKKLF